MGMERSAFGEFFYMLIKSADLTPTEFYRKLDITKPYFYEIVSGRSKPPPPHLQFQALAILNADNEKRNEFLDLAAAERNEVPADISEQIKQHPELNDGVRDYLKQQLANDEWRINENE